MTTWRVLFVVELRKTVDTRGPRWLLGIIGLLATATIALAHRDAPSFSEFIALPFLPLTALLPVLAIVTVTSDWNHRAAMTTFTLTPRRGRILSARLTAIVTVIVSTVVLVAVSTVACFAVLDPDGFRNTTWSEMWKGLKPALAVSLSAGLSGVAMGFFFLNTPLAVVVTILAPITYDVVLSVAIPGVAPWISSLAFSTWLAEPNATWSGSAEFRGLGQALSSFFLWIILPIALGWLRQTRKEVR